MVWVERFCSECRYFKEHSVKGTKMLDGHCELHSFNGEYINEYFDVWVDSSCGKWVQRPVKNILQFSR